jgi:hypothetical protein
VVFDFIDERYDLLEQDGAIVTRTWELDCLNLIGQPGLPSPRVLARLGPEVDDLWRASLGQMAALLETPALADAKVIVHHAQWARDYRDKAGGVQTFDLGPVDWESHNALLRHYRDLFVQAIPRTQVVVAGDEAQQGNEGHIWGLSPFHYVPEYYPDVWRQLQGVGI